TAVSQTMDELQQMPQFNKLRTERALRNLTNYVTFETATRLLNQRVTDRVKAIASGQAEQAEQQGEPESPTAEAPAVEEAQPAEAADAKEESDADSGA
ncbi:MAG: hypothetical protein GYA59_09125, partial [Chloroflexi bacterium]|nr:hypothetical protein [Chloroflexota bacterium]